MMSLKFQHFLNPSLMCQIYAQNYPLKKLGAIIRGQGTCSTCQSFNLTYHERTTCRHGYIRARTIAIGTCTYQSSEQTMVLTCHNACTNVPRSFCTYPDLFCPPPKNELVNRSCKRVVVLSSFISASFHLILLDFSDYTLLTEA